MRCVCCGCDKDAGAFSGAQKKKAVAKRSCISCTAAAATGDAVDSSSVVAKTSSAVSAGAAQRAVSQGADDTPSTTPSTAATPVSGTASGTDAYAASAEQGGTTRACSACGKQLAGAVDNYQGGKKCGRCKQAFYCGKACQVEHWKRGGHRQVCKEPMACCICLDNDGPPLPIQCGCGCREEAGCAHVACKIEQAKHQGPGYHVGWYTCPTCKQKYTGAMQLGLAETLWARLKGRPVEEQRRLGAQNGLANAYQQAGRYAEAEVLYRDLLATTRRVDDPNHANTLTVAGNLGSVLLRQCKHSDAEAVFRDTLERKRAVLGPEHASTLRTASGLAAALQNQSKYAEAEPVLRDTLAIQQRTLGDTTLATATSLALLLVNTGQHAEAEALSRNTLAQSNRTLGPDHPTSLDIARTLAITLGRQGQAAEAVALLTATLAMQQRVLGPGHPAIQTTAQELRRFQQQGLITAVGGTDHQGAQ